MARMKMNHKYGQSSIQYYNLEFYIGNSTRQIYWMFVSCVTLPLQGCSAFQCACLLAHCDQINVYTIQYMQLCTRMLINYITRLCQVSNLDVVCGSFMAMIKPNILWLELQRMSIIILIL